MVGTVIGPIRVRCPCELIIASSAAQTQSKVGGGFEILENSFGSTVNAGVSRGTVSAKCSNCESDIGPSCKCPIPQSADNYLLAVEQIGSTHITMTWTMM